MPLIRVNKMQIGQFPPIYHTAFEALSFWVAFRLYLWLRKRDSLNFQTRIPIVIGGILGAAIGSKLLYWLEDPMAFIQHIGDWQMLLPGKSLVGALIGGWVAIEISKKLTGVRSATGDSFVIPLAVGIMVGRIGCLLSGHFDQTFGTASDLPWAIDFGDGIRRHPNQLYEIVFLLGFVLAWKQLIKLKLQQGELWKIFILAYMGFRFLVEFIKPVPHFYFGLDIEQVIAICVYLYYAPYLISKVRPAEKEAVDGT